MAQLRKGGGTSLRHCIDLPSRLRGLLMSPFDWRPKKVDIFFNICMSPSTVQCTPCIFPKDQVTTNKLLHKTILLLLCLSFNVKCMILMQILSSKLLKLELLIGWWKIFTQKALEQSHVFPFLPETIRSLLD